MAKEHRIGGYAFTAGKDRSTSMISDQLTVDMTHGKAGDQIAKAMKNEIAAGIGAIQVDAAPETIERRKRRSRVLVPFAAEFERQLRLQTAGKKVRKKRKSKFLGKGKWGNDTGRLRTGLRVRWALDKPEVEVYLVNAPHDRADPDSKVWHDKGRNTGHYERFRANLFNYVAVLRDGELLWAKPNVQKAIKQALRKMFVLKVNKKMASIRQQAFGTYGLSPRIRPSR